VSPEPQVNILLVDDRPENLLALEAILDPLGENLVRANSGEDALAKLLGQDFALILLDVQMPGIDGFETATLIKKRERTSRVPIIFLTAINKDSGHVFRGYEVGAVDYLFKPFEPTVLRSKVEVFVDLHRKTSALELARVEQRNTDRLRALAAAASEINSLRSLDETLSVITDRARELIGAGQASTCVDAEEHFANGATAGSASPDGEREADDPVPALGRSVRHGGVVVRLDSTALAADPAWRGSAAVTAGTDPPHGWLGVPLTSPEGLAIGRVQVSDKLEGEFTADDESILLQLAQMASAAVETVRQYERTLNTAETLQRSLLPNTLPYVPGTSVAARYVGGSAGLEVGGDWYDVIPLSDGRVGLALGDVVGRGLGAATVMGQLRMALKAYALEGHDPPELAERLDQLVTILGIGQMTTVVYLVLDPATGALEFTCAGHPPPLVVSAAGEAAYLEGGRSLPLGVSFGTPFATGTATLTPDSTLVLYTDGLVEQRGVPIDDGLERLRVSAAKGPDGLEALCEHILAAGRTEGADDTALLAVRSVPISNELVLDLPADPAQLTPLRERFREWLEEAEASDEEIFEITTAFGEAVINAVEHPRSRGREGLDVRATLSSRDVAITVRDTGQWRPPRETDRGRGMPLMETLMDSVDVTATADGTVVRLRRRLREPVS